MSMIIKIIVAIELAACWFDDGHCEAWTAPECAARGGWMISGTCGSTASPVGACCLPDGACISSSSAECSACAGTITLGARCSGTCTRRPWDFNNDGLVTGRDIEGFIRYSTGPHPASVRVTPMYVQSFVNALLGTGT